jgi:hypothetical protein
MGRDTIPFGLHARWPARALKQARPANNVREHVHAARAPQQQEAERERERSHYQGCCNVRTVSDVQKLVLFIQFFFEESIYYIEALSTSRFPTCHLCTASSRFMAPLLQHLEQKK